MVLATSASGAELSALRRALDADEAITATASADDVEEESPPLSPSNTPWSWPGCPPSGPCSSATPCGTCGRAAGPAVRCVALLCGGIPRADLEEAGAQAVYADPAALLAGLEDSPLA